MCGVVIIFELAVGLGKGDRYGWYIHLPSHTTLLMHYHIS